MEIHVSLALGTGAPATRGPLALLQVDGLGDIFWRRWVPTGETTPQEWVSTASQSPREWCPLVQDIENWHGSSHWVLTQSSLLLLYHGWHCKTLEQKGMGTLMFVILWDAEDFRFTTGIILVHHYFPLSSATGWFLPPWMKQKCCLWSQVARRVRRDCCERLDPKCLPGQCRDQLSLGGCLGLSP